MLWFIWFLLIGMVAGWIAALIMRGEGFGIFGNMAIGVMGAFIGGFLFEWLNVSTVDGIGGALITSLTGAIVLLIVGRLIKTVWTRLTSRKHK